MSAGSDHALCTRWERQSRVSERALERRGTGYDRHMRLLVPLVLVSLVFLFLISVLAPRKSKRLQGWIDERLERGQEKGDRSAGRIGNWTAKTLAFTQRAADSTSRA